MSTARLIDLRVVRDPTYDHNDNRVLRDWSVRPATIDDLISALIEEGATVETVGEPGYWDHHEPGGFVAPGSYLVFRLASEERVGVEAETLLQSGWFVRVPRSGRYLAVPLSPHPPIEEER